jgi:hypothetical protein
VEGREKKKPGSPSKDGRAFLFSMTLSSFSAKRGQSMMEEHARRHSNGCLVPPPGAQRPHHVIETITGRKCQYPLGGPNWKVNWKVKMQNSKCKMQIDGKVERETGDRSQESGNGCQVTGKRIPLTLEMEIAYWKMPVAFFFFNFTFCNLHFAF